MSGRHPFSELTRDFTPERRRSDVKRRVDDMKRRPLELLAKKCRCMSFAGRGR